MKKAVFIMLLPVMSNAANYNAERTTDDGVEVVRLSDAAHRTEVRIAPSLGNNSYEMKVNGKNVFWSPYSSIADLKAMPAFLGNPFLAPWANRLDRDGFFANGKDYRLNPELKNFRIDSFKNPIHGLIAYSPHWQVVNLKADDKTAEVTSRLEFWRYPDYMAQFPFAHTIDMTYRLRDGALEVETVIENHATQPMPLSIGYHPYFRIHDAPRDQWTVTMPVRTQVMLSDKLLPTGETRKLSESGARKLDGIQLDDVFSGLIANRDGRAEFSVQGVREKISVIYGPKYPIAVVYAPKGRDFICFEPMTGPTNAFNLHHARKYDELQTVAPKGKWQESFWIKPSGF